MKPHEVKLARELLGLTQAELAQLLDRHAFTVSKWERGVLMPSLMHVAILSGVIRNASRETSRVEGHQIRQALASKGYAHALYLLLKFAVDYE